MWKSGGSGEIEKIVTCNKAKMRLGGMVSVWSRSFLSLLWKDGSLKDGGLKDGSLKDGSLKDGGLKDGGLKDGGLIDGGLKNGSF